MSGKSDEEWPEFPDLPPNATPEELIEYGRARRAAQDRAVAEVKKFEEQLEAEAKKAEDEGYADRAAPLLAKAREELAAVKVAVASLGKTNEPAGEIVRTKGHDI